MIYFARVQLINFNFVMIDKTIPQLIVEQLGRLNEGY